MFRISFTFLLTTARIWVWELYNSFGIIVLLWLLSKRTWLAAHIREGNNSQYYNEQYPIPTAAASWMVDILPLPPAVAAATPPRLAVRLCHAALPPPCWVLESIGKMHGPLDMYAIMRKRCLTFEEDMSARLMEIGFRPQLTLNSGPAETKGPGGWSLLPIIFAHELTLFLSEFSVGRRLHPPHYLIPPKIFRPFYGPGSRRNSKHGVASCNVFWRWKKN